MILAYAGIHRLGLNDRIRQKIPFEVMLPAVGQGAMAVEIRSDDTKVQEIVSALNDVETWYCITAERAFLRQLEGGWFSSEKITNSRSRVDRLGYFTEVNVEMLVRS